MKDVLALSAAIIAAVSTLPYLIDIVRGRTKPNIVTWITWTLLTALATLAAFAAHEPRTALLTLGSTICTLLVVLLGLRFGTAKLSFFDVVCWVGVVVGLLLWWIFNSPVIAIFAAVTIDFIGLLPTLRHSWILPNEETWQAFTIGTIAAIVTLTSLDTFSIASLLYPLYLLFADGIIVLIILYRRKTISRSTLET